jgi:predicted acylesterase/phospholipase RssA/CRP-like cAMP-binding protein
MANCDDVADQQVNEGAAHPRSLAFLAGDDARDLAAVAALEAASTLRRLDTGDVLLAGPPDMAEQDAHLLVEGGLEIRADATVIERLEAGQCLLGRPHVGEGIAPSTVSVVAAEPATVLTIPEAALARLQVSAPAVWRRLHGFFGHRIPSLFLASTELFHGTDPALLEHCDDPANWIQLDAGQVLFRQGDPADALYLVVHGSLEVVQEDRDGGSRVLGTLARGDALGETALLVEQGRTATVRAIRDSEVARVSRADFERLMVQDPAIGIRVARVLATRLMSRNQAVRNPRSRVRTVAVLADRGSFAADLAAALETTGSRVGKVSSSRVERQLGREMLLADANGRPSDRLLAWLSGHEDRFDIVLYECDDKATPWTTWSIRQADVLLVVTAEETGPGRRAVETAVITPKIRARVELVIVHPGPGLPTGTRRWLASREVAAHHHVRRGVPGDLLRLARSLNGTTIGVALSGGGARGFAHIGALRAMQEWGWSIDHIGGTSMGSVIAAEHAMGMSTDEMVERNRREFTSAPVSRDLTLPIVSLGRGHSSVQLLKRLFGDVHIEDLPIPYFCVSCNLSRASEVIHDRGPIWLWARASSSVPGIMPPVPSRTDLLVDGGVLNNLPVDVLRLRCTGTVVAVDVSGQATLRTDAPDQTAVMSGWPLLGRHLGRRGGSVPGILQILARTTTLSSVQNLAMVRAHTDLYLRPPVEDVSPFDWDAIDRVVEVGYRSTLDRLQAWEAAGRPSASEEAAPP